MVSALPPCTFDILVNDTDNVNQIIDIDKDGDGLIEICDLEGLNAIRHQLDGTGYKVNADATKITTGCRSGGCRGFELARSLDFMANDSYLGATNIVIWTTGDGWEPIGTLNMPFNAIFDGNGHTISNLMIDRSGTSRPGLFSRTESSAKIANLGLLDVNIKGLSTAGGLTGRNDGSIIINSYATGAISGSGSNVGGLAGLNNGTITNSYAMVSSGSGSARGGLVGSNNSTIRNSYATGTISGSGSNVGGLAGRNSAGTIANTYATGTVSGSGTNRGGLVGWYSTGRVNDSYWQSGSASSGGRGVAADARKTVEMLTSPTTATDIYSNWSTDNWDFGNSNQFPALKYAKGTDTNYLTCSDIPPQTGTDQPQCGTLLPHQGMNIGDRDSGLREDLRKLEISRVNIEGFNTPLGVSTNNYVVTILLPDGTTEYDIALRLEAYNPDAEIQIFREGDDSTDYFEGKMSGQSSSGITVGEGTKLTIRVNESNTDYTLTFAVRVGPLPGI